MKPSKSSKTAQQMALSRALEALRPPGERICLDPLAERFLDRGYRMLLHGRPLRAAVERLIERLFPGHHHYVLLRTRYLDETLSEQLADGARQLVILGAGYDSRPYRFGDRLAAIPVFEVDHPATSKAKRARIERTLGALPAHVRYVPVDFNKDKLDDQLQQAGYREELRTLFLWEGTTPYVSSQGVEDTLRFVVSHSGVGSMIVFDYVLRSVLDGACAMRGAENELEKMKRTTEPFVFGLAAEEVTLFLSSRGFRGVLDVGAEELKDRFLRGDRRSAYVKPWWRIVRASVEPPPRPASTIHDR